MVKTPSFYIWKILELVIITKIIINTIIVMVKAENDQVRDPKRDNIIKTKIFVNLKLK